MARYFFNVVVPAMQLSRAVGILPALSMSRSENPTNRQQDVNSKKRRGSQHPSRTSESSHTSSHPRTRSWRDFHVEGMTPSEMIMRDRLKHCFTQKTKLNEKLHVETRGPWLQKEGKK